LEIAGTLLRNVVRPFLWLRRRDECRREPHNCRLWRQSHPSQDRRKP
jgi:hypothetical protein